MRRWASCVLVPWLACGGSSGTAIDAPTSAIDGPTSAIDAPPSAIDAPPAAIDAVPGTGYQVFLSFDNGFAMHSGNTDNPATNISTIVTGTYATASYLANDPDRATKIAGIVGEVEAILAPYGVTIVTARPASGTYDLIVAGNTPQQAGLPAGVFSVTPPECDSATGTPHVMLLFDVGVDQHEAAHEIVAMIGIAHTVPQSTVALDCMCYANPQGCGTLAAACTIAGAATPVDTALACASAPSTMDEHGEWLRVFGAHP